MEAAPTSNSDNEFKEVDLVFTAHSSSDNSRLANVSCSFEISSNFHNFSTNRYGIINTTIHSTVTQGDTVDYSCSRQGYIPIEGNYTVGDSARIKIFEIFSANLDQSHMYRAVLTWGEKPDDLDLAVWEIPLDRSRDDCITKWHKPNCKTTHLDIDNRQGGHNGAETITWGKDLKDYAYIIYVNNYKNKEARRNPNTTELVKSKVIHQLMIPKILRGSLEVTVED